ncbi:MAG: hypothetical protein LBG60_14520 [Bifidobacteriaceae bacterium]|jgi:predicted nucleic acid-binding protein|nr:hypothetical protein [Bifidobacteriaceae bacterium]
MSRSTACARNWASEEGAAGRQPVDRVDRSRPRLQRPGQDLGRQFGGGWATCPITENGFARIVAQPSCANPVSAPEAISLLERVHRLDRHECCACDTTIADPAAVARDLVLGSGQVTDTHLLALAVNHGGALATLDRRITPAAVPGATAAHQTIHDAT